MADASLNKTFEQPKPVANGQRGRDGAVRLVLILMALSVIWLAVLPRLALLPRIAARAEWLREKQIYPAAMYYTEVEALEQKLKRLDMKARHCSASARAPL